MSSFLGGFIKQSTLLRISTTWETRQSPTIEVSE